MSSLRLAACVVTLVSASAVTNAQAAETVSPEGWICTTEAPPAVPASGPERARVRAIRPVIRFSDSGRLTMRFAAPVSSGARIVRTGGDLASRYSIAPCNTTGFVDDQTRDGHRYQYKVTAVSRDLVALTAGNKLPHVKDRGRVVVIVESSLWNGIRQSVEGYFANQIRSSGWEVVTEVVGANDSPASVRAKLRARHAQSPSRTTTALLVGHVPVAYSGGAQSGGARPTDSYYADVDGTWTDSTVAITAPAANRRSNIAGDGRFDQEAAPSSLEFAVGRVDFSRLPAVRRGGDAIEAEQDATSSYLMRAADGRDFDDGATRDEAFVIDAGDPAVGGNARGWQSATGLTATARAGTRAELDAANEAERAWYVSRPTFLQERGRGTPSTLTTWLGSQPGDIASATSVGAARFVASDGVGLDDWDQPDSLLRSRIVGWSGADATTHRSLALDGLALGDTLGTSFRAGLQETGFRPDQANDPLGSLLGDPTMTLRARGYTDQPVASVATGCEDAKTTWTVLGVAAGAKLTADVYRIVDGGAAELVQADAPMSWNAEDRAYRGTTTDVGVVTEHPRASVRYEIRPKALHTTNRGSFFTEAPVERSEAISLRCTWTCAAPTGPIPTDPVEGNRSAQLESTVSFSDGGRKVSIALDRRHTGRSLSAARTDVTEPATPEMCDAGLAASAYGDDRVEPGRITSFELSISGRYGKTAVLAGHNLPGSFDRGRLLVVTDASVAGSPTLQAPLQRWQEALEADGYELVSVPVQRTDSVASVRTRLRAAHAQDPARTKTAVLIGHVPVPYSGSGAYDGHGDHQGGWATDGPYADLDGAWTDTINLPNPPRPQNRNVPGDGKFDQNRLPSKAELAVGRIDFADMPALGGTEASLIADYLTRDLRYRRGELPFRNEGFTKDNFGFNPAGVLSNVSPVVGAANVRINQSASQVRETTKTGGQYFLAYAAGPGSYSTSGGVGTVTDPVPALFLGSLGSYYGDWDSTNNFLRGHLRTGLGALWEDWAVDGMALGETIGDTVRRNMDTQRPGQRFPLNSFLGDPTLRAYPLKGVTDASASDESGSCIDTRLDWTPSTDPSVEGYHVERRYSGVWRQITSAPLPRSATHFIQNESRPFYTGAYFRVRPVREQATSRGSFTNVGQGELLYASSCD